MNCEQCANGIFCPSWGSWKCVAKIMWLDILADEEKECDLFIAKKANDEEKKCHCKLCMTLGGIEDE